MIFSECAHAFGLSIALYLKVHVDGPEDIPRSRSTCHAERGQGLLLTYIDQNIMQPSIHT
jgi:hypothetical protein